MPQKNIHGTLKIEQDVLIILISQGAEVIFERALNDVDLKLNNVIT